MIWSSSVVSALRFYVGNYCVKSMKTILNLPEFIVIICLNLNNKIRLFKAKICLK
jgi:hypothetical protein